MAKLVNMRGLQNFISEIRSCKNKEQEKTRVDKELGKIRKKFAGGGNLTEYDKKKYVWKLLYIYMLGYEVEFGHKQASDLIAAQRYAEKQVGYMACSILLSEKDEFLRLVINSIRNDLICRNEAFQCLALNFIGGVGGVEMSALLANDVMGLLTNGAVRPIVRKKAALALLRLLRKSTSDIDELLQAEVWSPRINALLEETDVGVLIGAVTLLLGVVARSYEGYETAVPRLVRILERLRAREVTPDYTYYGIASPWLQVKVLRVLQYFPASEDPVTAKLLNELLKGIITANEVVKNVNKNNAQHSIVFEAVALALAIEADADLLNQGVALLGKFISVREPNIKYLGLENMVRLAEVPAVMDTVNKHQKSIIASLKEADVSIRRRALDLLFTMATPANCNDIVDEMLKYLNVADFSMREELVLKTAVLAERFFPSLEWYVDVMLTLIERAGEFASRDVWHSTVQLVTNHDELHAYAAGKIVEALRRGTSHEALTGAAAYLLGEYGALLTDVTPREQFQLLNERFAVSNNDTKALLLSAYLKIQVFETVDEALKQDIAEVYQRYSHFMDAELQQRAVEYAGLSARPGVAAANVLPMPHWEKRKSLLLRRLAQREGADADEVQQRPVWLQGQEEEDEAGAAAGGAMAALTVAAPPPPLQQPASPHLNGGSAASQDLLGAEDEAEVASAAPASPPPPQQNGGISSDVLDLLGLSPGYSEPAAAQRPGPPTVGVAHDPFADLGTAPNGIPAGLTASTSQPTTAAPAGPAAPAAAGDAIQPLGDPASWYNKLITSDAGILYEDNFLQIGVKSQFKGPQGQLTLFFGNKGAEPLQRVICAVPPTPQFHFQLAAVPATLLPRKQVQVAVEVQVVAPFSTPPRLQVGYTTAGGAVLSQALQLPTPVTKFASPPAEPIPRDTFFSRWRSLSSAPLKQTERVSRAQPISKGPMQALLAALRLAELPGLDPEPENLVAAALFSCAPPNAPPTQVPIMVRIEVEKTQHLQLQVTVATPDVTITSAVKDLLVQLLSAI